MFLFHPKEKAWFERSQTDNLFRELEELVGQMYAKLRKGDFTKTGTTDCDFCGFREVCRQKFAVR